MRSIVVVGLLVASAQLGLAQPLSLGVVRDGDTLHVSVALERALPEAFDDALTTGAVVNLSYRLQVRSHRRMWWAKKVWRGLLVVSTAYDPVIGRYRLEAVLDDVIVASREVQDPAEARRWLVAPPAVGLALRERNPRWQSLQIRARAEFATDTVWLIFPTTDATEWVERSLAELESSEPTPTPGVDPDPQPPAEP